MVHSTTHYYDIKTNNVLRKKTKKEAKQNKYLVVKTAYNKNLKSIELKDPNPFRRKITMFIKAPTGFEDLIGKAEFHYIGKFRGFLPHGNAKSKRYPGQYVRTDPSSMQEAEELLAHMPVKTTYQAVQHGKKEQEMLRDRKQVENLKYKNRQKHEMTKSSGNIAGQCRSQP